MLSSTNPKQKKSYTLKKLSDMIISGEPLAERVREFIGREANVESSVDYMHLILTSYALSYA